jgi:hypothetical protein
MYVQYRIRIGRIIKRCGKSSGEFGPTLLQNVSYGFSKTAAQPLTKESRTNIRDKIKVPENCKEFIVPRVNTEIWKLLPAQAKIQDIEQQQIQQTLSAGLSSLAYIANNVATNKDKIPKEVVSSIIKQSMDSANLLGDQFQSISTQRRYEMKKFLNPEVSGICSGNFPASEYLFGTDLAENLKSSKATASLMRNTMNRGMRYHPYNQPRQDQGQGQSSSSLNYTRPFYNNQSRGSGQYQRFSRRPPGQFRMLNPSNYQQQSNYRKN